MPRFVKRILWSSFWLLLFVFSLTYPKFLGVTRGSLNYEIFVLVYGFLLPCSELFSPKRNYKVGFRVRLNMLFIIGAYNLFGLNLMFSHLTGLLWFIVFIFAFLFLYRFESELIGVVVSHYRQFEPDVLENAATFLCGLVLCGVIYRAQQFQLSLKITEDLLNYIFSTLPLVISATFLRIESKSK